MADSMHANWKKIKDKYKKDLDMSKVCKQENLGAKLDAYEAQVKAFDKLTDQLQRNPDDAKEKAAKAALMAAADKAAKASAAYIASLNQIEKHGTGALKAAAEKLSAHLAYNVYDLVSKVAKGNLRR